METIKEWAKTAQEIYPEREESIRALLVGAAAGLNVLFEGPPGTGKTALVDAFTHAAGLDLFSVQLSSWTDDAALLGPVDLQALAAGTLARKGAGFLADCEVAFLDELPRAGRGIRDLVLSALGNRRLPDKTPIRARMICAAANSALTDEEDRALADRFAIVVRVDKVRDPIARLALMLGGGNPQLPPLRLPAVGAHKAVRVPRNVAEAFAEMSAEMGSVRRWIAATDACKAHALLEGREEVGWEDVRAVLPLTIPGSGDDAGDGRRRIEALIDEHGPQGETALRDLKELGERLIALGKRDPTTYTDEEAAAYARRWNTISENVEVIRRDYPSCYEAAETIRKALGQQDKEVLMDALSKRIEGGSR